MSIPAPISERFMLFRHPRMEPEAFAAFQNAWKEEMAKHNGNEELINKWEFALPITNQVPDLSKMTMKFISIYRYWFENKVFCIQVYPDCVSFSLVSYPNIADNKFTNLEQFTLKFLPLWMQVSGISCFSEFSLQYLNQFDIRKLTPFMIVPEGKEGSFYMGKAFTIITAPQVYDQSSYTSDYCHKFTLNRQTSRIPNYLTVELRLGSFAKPLNLNFGARHVCEKPMPLSNGMAQVQDIMTGLHEEISTAFRSILSKELLDFIEISPS